MNLQVTVGKTENKMFSKGKWTWQGIQAQFATNPAGHTVLKVNEP